MIIQLVAIVYLVLLIFTISFQFGLIVGRPWGEWTMGGYYKDVLPLRLRFGAFVSMIILGYFSLVIVDKALPFNINLDVPDWVGFVIITFNVLAVFANSITKSQKEKRLWQPITVVMFVCSLVLFLV